MWDLLGNATGTVRASVRGFAGGALNLAGRALSAMGPFLRSCIAPILFVLVALCTGVALVKHLSVETTRTPGAVLLGVVPTLMLLFFSVIAAVGFVVMGWITFSERKKLSRRQRWRAVVIFACVAVISMAAVNFGLYATGAVLIKGAATGTVVEDGRYYVIAHGDETVVSRDVWIYSYYHGMITTILSTVAGLVIGCLVLWASPRPHSLNVVVDADGTITADGREVAIDEIVAAWKARRGTVYVTQEYAGDMAPPAAVRLYSELTGRRVPVQTVKKASRAL